jgi:hypothetical protein
VLGFEQVARSAEALQRLKPQQVRALWLKAMGNSYQEICDATGWSYTKVNRCLAEGRKSFLARYAGIEAGDECRRWAPVLSAMVDGEATAEQMLQLRPHLRNCAGCRSALRELRASNTPLAALFPVGGAALAGDDGGRLDAAGDLLSRLWHSLVGDLGERAAAAAFRAQSVAEAVVPGKSMAVVASVAPRDRGGDAAGERAAPCAEAPAAGAGAPEAGSGGEAARAPGDRRGGGAPTAGGRDPRPGAAAGPGDRPARGPGAPELGAAKPRHAREAGGDRVRRRDALSP